ncbi:MAG: adenine phosphoribosyltransferase [Thermoguttaceae bacterium]|jgi:adenine phosphoribosyltransferase
MKPLADYIRTIPDFPKPGILFRDIVPLIEDVDGLSRSIEVLKEGVSEWGPITKVAGVEARGFIFSAPLALELNAGFVPVRKPGKLPFETVSVEYSLEYGTNRIEMHKDSLKPTDRVLLVDDLLATGGTMAACRKLVEGFGATVIGAAVIIELVDLKGRDRLSGIPLFAPVKFGGE